MAIRRQLRRQEEVKLITYLFLAGLVATISLLVVAGAEESFEGGFRA